MPVVIAVQEAECDPRIEEADRAALIEPEAIVPIFPGERPAGPEFLAYTESNRTQQDPLMRTNPSQAT